MADINFVLQNLDKLLESDAVGDREAISKEHIEELVSQHLKVLDEETQLVRKILCLYAFSIADGYNRIRISNRGDKEQTTSVMPYVRIRPENNHVEMVWVRVKNWVEHEFRPHSNRVRQYKRKSGDGTVNVAVGELKKYKLENGDFSMRMFDGEPEWTKVVGEEVEKNLRVLRTTRKLLTEIMYKKRSVILGLKKLSNRFSNPDSEEKNAKE